jgi:hypothetical protein
MRGDFDANRVYAPHRKHPGEGGEERAIGGPKSWPRLLPTQHHQLMPQNQQLDVLGELAAPPPMSSRNSAANAR